MNRSLFLVNFRKSFSNMDYLQQLYARLFGTNPEDIAINSSSSNNNNNGNTSTNNLPRKVVAFGNVLLDHTAHINDTELLDRYKLSLNTRAEMDVETISKVTAEAIVNKEEDPHLGGSALNTVRILKNLGTEALFFGAVGDDKQAGVVADLLTKSGMETNNFRLQTIADTPTGRCICLVHKDSLALYANIGASSKFSTDYLAKVQQEENAFFLRNSGRKQIFYVEGFFVPQREEVSTYIVTNFIKGRRRLAVNLSADYIVKMNYDHMIYLINNAMFVFGNKDEFETLRECWGAINIEELIRGILDYSTGPKIFVMTKGADGVELITNYEDELSPPGKLTFQMFNTPRIENIVDTTGCGDAFAAAFLHAWLEKRILSECIRFACDISAKVATQVGCNLP
ncbi:adenosine kinase isoform X1 [Lucilia cuprina]|uniref:adenosine kinase isoform X1 n=2 Tax=Lucilia cuprina TaxID=7375 RepID=UPI001F05742B|nr:adenosine kinase isoform X1 [Lucilia cuprina]